MRHSRLASLNFMALCCVLGLFTKKLINPLANVITEALHIPGGISTGFSIMFLVVAAEVVRGGRQNNDAWKYCGTLMGMVQGFLALCLGRIGSMGLLAPLGYLVPGVAIDLVYGLGRCFGFDRTERMVFSNALAAVMAVSMVACGGGEDTPAYDVNEVLATIEEAAPVRMSTPVDEEYMNFIGIDAEMYNTFAGSYCPITPGVDGIIVVEAKDGKVEDVKAALEARRNEIFAANENYVGALRDKAEAGRVVVKGNYAVLVIGGDDIVVEDQGVEKAYEPIDAAIDEAFK